MHESLYLSLIDQAIPDALFVHDHEGRFLEVNARACDSVGYTRSELLAMSVVDIEQDFDLASAQAEWSRIKPNTTTVLYGHHRRKDGSIFPVEIHSGLLESGDQRFYVGIVHDISERKCLENELGESRHLLRELAGKIEMLREEERRCIAREVHDELGQILTALRMDVALLNLRFGVGNAALMEKMQGMTVLLDRADRCVRDIVSNLHPTVLDMGIVSAVGWLCTEFSVHTGSPCVLQAVEEHIELDEARAAAVFRIVQELLTNVARHADASSVEIMLATQGDDLRVSVRDNGKGFDPVAAEKNRSFGLVGIRERAIALGGDVDIVSAPHRGTTVTVMVPAKSKEITDDSSIDCR